MKEKVKVYVHSDKEYMWNIGEALGMKGDVLRRFAYALSEVVMELEVDVETGYATITKCDGKELT